MGPGVAHTIVGLPCNGLVFGNLDLHTTPWRKLGNHNAFSNLLVVVEIRISLEAVVEGTQVGGSNDVRNMGGLQIFTLIATSNDGEQVTYVVAIESQRFRSTLWATPERLPSAGETILGKTEEKLTDGVVVLVLELKTSPNNALLESERLVCDEVRDDLFDLLLLLTGEFERGLEVIRLRKVGVDGLRWPDEEVLELLPTPLDGMADGIGEVLDRARRSLFLRRVL
jgi:hypothetical protein